MSAELLGLLTLFLAVPLNAVVMVILFRQSRKHPTWQVLWERFITSAAVLFLLIVFGLIFWNNDQAVPPINEDWTKIITRAAMFGAGLVSAGYWLWLHFKRRKKGGS